MTDKPQVLISTDNALLLAGVGALLHNLGKVTPQFFESMLLDNVSPDYLFQHILHLIDPHSPNISWDGCSKLSSPENHVLAYNTIKALTSWPIGLLTPLDDRQYVSGDLIEYLSVSEPWYQEQNGKYNIEHIFSNGSRLTHLMQRAHHGASGGEKQGIWTEQQNDPDNLYRATPMGWEVPAPNRTKILTLQKEVEQVIQRYLLAPNIPFPLHKFSEELRPLLNQAIADTQRPLNDITVWDIGLSGMAFLLPQAIGLMAQKRAIDHTELAKKDGDNTLFWRVLSLRTDGLDFLNNAPTLADLRVRYQRLKKSLSDARQKLEKMPVATQVYQDENGSFFVFPDLPEEDWKIVQQVLTSHLEIDGVHLASMCSEKLVNAPGDKGGDYIGDYIQRQITTSQLPRHHQPDAYLQPWSEATTEICVACGVRPQGAGTSANYYREKAINRHLCYPCMEGRSGVSEQWVQTLSQPTVWIDEVADANGRLALMVGKWGIEQFVPTVMYPHNVEELKYPELQLNFLSASPPDGHKFQLRNSEFSWDASRCFLVGPPGTNILAKFQNDSVTIHAPLTLNVTIQDITFDGSEYVLELQEDLTQSGLAENAPVKCWGQDFVVIGNRAMKTKSLAARNKVLTSILWGDQAYPFTVTTGTEKVTIKITGGTKSQSFARLRRVWETTRSFWQEVLPTDKDKEVAQSVVGKAVKPTGPRLEIRGKFNRDDSPGRFHTYELVLKQIRLSVVWDPNRGRFITCDNLKYLTKPEQLGQDAKEWLDNHKGHSLIIEEPTGYGGENKRWGTITVEHVGELPDTYLPVIPILAEPRTFMALVPANKAVEVAQAIKNKYELEMGKVRNRLPLHLGVVYFHRRTPLRAALETGRRMLGQPVKNSKWQVRRIEDKSGSDAPAHLQDNHYSQWRELYLQRDEREIIWCVPLKMGDGQTEDHWYPYVQVETNGDESKMTGRQWVFTSPNGSKDDWLVHVSELRKDDEIYFTPSTFDFEFLDTTGRRFELHYDEEGRRKSRSTRPWLLDDLARLESLWQQFSQLSRSQINQIIGAIENARETWRLNLGEANDAVFRQFVADTLAGAGWPKEAKWKIWSQKDRHSLIEAAVSGVLTDLVELHLQILKERE